MTRVRVIVVGTLLAASALFALVRGSESATSPPGRTEAVRAPSPLAAPTGRLEPPALAATEPAKATVPESEAKRLTRLAETSDDPRVIEASFASILTTYAARSSKKPGPDADLERAIVKHVGSERSSTVVAALEAARIALMAREPRPGVTSAVAGLAGSEQPPAKRYAALEALNLLRPDRRAENVLVAFEEALVAKQPELVSLALLALSQSRASFEAATEPTRTRIAARIVTLLGHYDPGVRGHALLVLSEIPTLVPAKERYGAAERALGDREAFVRARGADLFARCGEPMAIHLLIEHVRDLAAARYELRGFSTLDGKPGTLVHEVPGRKRVAEAALFAILALSRSESGSTALVLTLGGVPASDALVLENAEIASTWYAAVRASIPNTPLRAAAAAK